MTNTVLIKRSSAANAVPSAGNLQAGELAINYNDGNLFYKNTSNVVTVIASNQFVSVSGNITGGNVNTGNISAAGNITVVGITSTGTVDLSNSGNISLGNVGNVHITGGSSGYVLTTNGSGNLTWVEPTAGGSVITVDEFTGNGVQTQFTLSVTPPNINSTTVNYNGIVQLRTSYSLVGANIVFPSAPANGSSIEVTSISVNLSGAAGANTQVQFNAGGGALGASAAFTFNTSTNTLSATNYVGNGSQLTGVVATDVGVLPSLSVTGTTTTGNLQTSGFVSAAGNITAGNVLFNGGIVSGSGNISAGNLLTTGLVSSAGIISSGNVNLISSGNISLGNVGNVHINGGTNGYVLTTNGSGNLDWTQIPSSTITVDDFTGNGVQTQFTLSVTPNGINDTTVNYNGTMQLRTSYSLVGANIVFPSAPANGSSIEVTTVSNTVISTSASGSNTQIQFNDAGSLGASSAFTFDKTSNSVAVGSVNGSRSNIAVTISTTIDTFATTAYRGAKYLIQGGDGVDYQASDVLLVHNGTSAFINQSSVCSNNISNVFSVSASVSSGNVVLSATKISANATNLNLTVLYVKD